MRSKVPALVGFEISERSLHVGGVFLSPRRITLCRAQPPAYLHPSFPILDHARHCSRPRFHFWRHLSFGLLLGFLFRSTDVLLYLLFPIFVAQSWLFFSAAKREPSEAAD